MISVYKEESLVSQETFSREVMREAASFPYVPEEHNGKRNPYTGTKITTENEYYEYRREYVYHRLCDEMLRIQYEQKFASQIQHYTKVHEKELYWKKIFSRVRFLALLLALIYVLVYYLPNQKNLAFQEGQTDGYTSGFDGGYASGLSDGYTSGYDDGYEKGEKTKSSGNNGTSYLSPNRIPAENSTIPNSSELSSDSVVYVSKSGHKIHLKSNCSGMRSYYTMAYAEALSAGYAHCSKCF